MQQQISVQLLLEVEEVVEINLQVEVAGAVLPLTHHLVFLQMRF